MAGSEGGGEDRSLRRCSVLGVRVVAEPVDRVLDAVEAALSAPARDALSLCPVAVHTVLEARRDPELRCFLNGAGFVVADGMPLVRTAQLLGHREARRARGPDVMWELLERTRSGGAAHFFYGGRDGVAQELARRVSEAFPGIRIAGAWTPPLGPLTPEEEDEAVARINASGADVVWVGLSSPKQERWAAALAPRLDVKLVATVGAAFDYHTGALRSAPRWMQGASLEWVYRLIQEPRRLWRRYAVIVPLFIGLALLQVLGLRRYRDD